MAKQSSDDIELKSISASGEGLSSGKTGEKCLFTISGVPAGQTDALTYSCDGPSKPDIRGGEKDGKFEAHFVPLVAGDYKITIRFKGRQIPGSPFKCKVTGETVNIESLLSKVCIKGLFNSILIISIFNHIKKELTLRRRINIEKN